MAKFELESGVVYERQSQYFLAVGPDLLVTRSNRGWVEVQPYERYRVQRDVSVGELKQSWGITARELDDFLANYFQPHRDHAKAERGSRRRAWSHVRWRQFRTFRHTFRTSR